jgi:hypothetical protein
MRTAWLLPNHDDDDDDDDDDGKIWRSSRLVRVLVESTTG